jgi:Transposase, Mutator family
LGSQDRQRAEQGTLSVQINMKADLREIYGAPTRAAAEAAIDVFADKYGAKYDKAIACLTKDREALLAFFDFPTYIKPDRERVRDGAASNRADKGSPVGQDRQAHGVQTGQCRCENVATIEGRKSVAQSRPRRQIPKTASRSSKCRLTTPPDRSRHPISRIALKLHDRKII